MESPSDLYTLEWATKSHMPEILSFMYENFDKEEIMLKCLRDNNSVATDLENSMRLDHERLIRAIISFSPCVLAVEKSLKKIIGVNLMIISKNPKFNSNGGGVAAAFDNNPPSTEIMKRYFNYLAEISESADVYGKFPNAKKAVEFYAVATDKSYRRMGISNALMAAGISFARDTVQDVDLIFGVYTSLYSKKAAERLGLKSIMDVDLLTYKDSNGRLVFKDAPPHNIVSVMIMEVK